MHSPVSIDLEPGATIAAAAGRITLKPDTLILLLGSVDASLEPQVRSFCARVIAPVALLTNALIVDDGATPGVSAQMALAARQLDQPPDLLAILDPAHTASAANHTLLRMPAAWADPARSRIQIVAELAGSARPLAVLLFGGVDADLLTVLRCARRGWPILIVQGAGGVGDSILTARAAALAAPAGPVATDPVNDPEIAEILNTAALCALPLRGNADDLTRLLLSPLRQPGEVLVDAWGRHDDLNHAAKQKQKQFHITQFAILALAVLATLLAILSGRVLAPSSGTALLPASRLRHGLHLFLILVPISISVLSGFSSRFREGNKWVLLRAAAESIKREIFTYRARACAYSDEQCTQVSAPSKLAASMKEIHSNLVQSEVNRSSIASHAVQDPSRLTFLTPEQFLTERIEDQRTYFIEKTARLYKRLRGLQLCILLAGGLGTFLAAINLDVWVALTTGLATALATKLETDQVETSLVQYNVALTNLNNIKSWWAALTPWEKTRRGNIDLLVGQTEKTLERETAGWVQQMQSALQKLTEKQARAEQPAESSATH